MKVPIRCGDGTQHPMTYSPGCEGAVKVSVTWSLPMIILLVKIRVLRLASVKIATLCAAPKSWLSMTIVTCAPAGTVIIGGWNSQFFMLRVTVIDVGVTSGTVSLGGTFTVGEALGLADALGVTVVVVDNVVAVAIRVVGRGVEPMDERTSLWIESCSMYPDALNVAIGVVSMPAA